MHPHRSGSNHITIQEVVMGSWKSSICQHCTAPFRSKNLPKQRYCSKRCGGLAKRLPVLERLRAKLTNLHDPYDCWEWTGATIGRGYGTIKRTDRPRTKREQLTHRTMWIETIGPIADDLLVLHHCDNPPCCNPRHLFLGTKKDNAIDAYEKGRLSDSLTAARFARSRQAKDRSKRVTLPRADRP